MTLSAEEAIARMERSLKEFQEGIDRRSGEWTEEQVLVILKRLAFEGLRRLTNKTPVDTGRARGNWQVTIGRPPEFALNRVDKTGQKTISAGAGVINKLSNAFTTVWITNNVVYILPLEGGHSKKQAPNGMMAVTLAELQSGFVGGGRFNRVNP